MSALIFDHKSEAVLYTFVRELKICSTNTVFVVVYTCVLKIFAEIVCNQAYLDWS